MDLDPTAGRELKKLEKYVRALPSVRRVTSLGTQQKKIINDMQDALYEAVKLNRDAGMANTSDIMFVSLTACAEQLKLFEEHLLAASSYDLLDTADVAQLSAVAEHISDLITKR